MRYFKMSLSNATNATHSVWLWQHEIGIKLSMIRTRGSDVVVVSTQGRLGEAMLRQVLIEDQIPYVETEQEPTDIAKGFGS